MACICDTVCRVDLKKYIFENIKKSCYVIFNFCFISLWQTKPVKMIERSIYSAKTCFIENLYQS